MDIKTSSIFLIIGLFLISLTSATGNIGIVKAGDCIDLYNFCPTCSYINLTAMKFPSGSTNLTNEAMTNLGNNYIYSFCNTSLIGEYFFTTCGDKDGSVACEDIAFESTGNGRPTPSGIVVLGFSLIMILIFSTVIFFIIRAVGLIIDANFDILDISYSWGLYFGLLGINLLSEIYLGNVIISEWLGLLVTWLGFPFIVLPVLAFFLSLFRTKKKEKEKKAEW